MNNRKLIVIGLDLSFNSTGITVYNEHLQTLSFHRIVYEKKTYRNVNVNMYAYTMPINISPDDLLFSNNDKNNRTQIESTLRAMICAKQIKQVLNSCLSGVEFDDLVIVFENYIMPAFGGRNSLQNVSGLILLQGYIREYIIQLAVGTNKNIKILTPTPSQNKKFFTGDGKADKHKMIDTFVNVYDGNRLIPDYNVSKIDDVIDSFSLMCQGLFEYRNNQ